MNYFLALIALLLGCVFLTFIIHRYKEPFGFSNGTLVQLATSHVPTADDEEDARAELQQIQHDLRDMTEP